MGWFHDTGYGSAYAHEGYPASVLDDGTDTSTYSVALAPRIVGWRAACSCGWRCAALFSRAEWPSVNGDAPAEVDGWESGTGCFRDWEAHMGEAVPELEIYDLSQRIVDLQRELEASISQARGRGVSWATIGRVAGLTSLSARQRWEE